MVNLQRQMCQQLEAVQVSLSTPNITESIVVKPTLFHGRENENVDRWLQRFSLYLANGKISPSSDQAAVKHEKLNEKFNCLDLRNEDKMFYLILQGLRADIQTEVSKKEPKTYTEGENTARLIYSIQQSTLQSKEEDASRIVQAASRVPSTTNAGAAPEIQGALARIQHQLDNVMSNMAKTPSMSEAAVNACQYSPLDPNVLYDKVSRLDQVMQQILSVLGNRPQENKGSKIAAYQPTTVQSADEELRYLRDQARQLSSINSEEHFHFIVAY